MSTTFMGMNMIEKEFSRISTAAISKTRHDGRGVSFDFCYLYFRQPKEVIINNMEASCYALWAFLASWGMLRGSTELLRKNPSCLVELVNHLVEKDLTWIDLDNYDKEETKDTILEEYRDIQRILKENCRLDNPSLTLVTKIMLGVYSCILAFDEHFKRFYKTAFGHTVTRLTGDVINNLFLLSKYVVYEEIPMINFFGKKTESFYNKAKQLDMYAWVRAAKL